MPSLCCRSLEIDFSVALFTICETMVGILKANERPTSRNGEIIG